MLDNAKLDELRASTVGRAGNRLAMAIELSGKKQGEVADELEMPQSQLSDLARGRFADPKLSTLQKLGAYFGCAIEDLFPSRVSPRVTDGQRSLFAGTDRRSGERRKVPA